MSTPADNGSWTPRENDVPATDGASAQPGQDPWAQPPASQDPYAHGRPLTD